MRMARSGRNVDERKGVVIEWVIKSSQVILASVSLRVPKPKPGSFVNSKKKAIRKDGEGRKKGEKSLGPNSNWLDSLTHVQRGRGEKLWGERREEEISWEMHQRKLISTSIYPCQQLNLLLFGLFSLHGERYFGFGITCSITLVLVYHNKPSPGSCNTIIMKRS